MTRAGLDTGHRFGTNPRDADRPWGADAEADSCPGLLPSADGLFIHRRENLAGVLQGWDESRRVHLVDQGPDFDLTHASDERCDTEAFKRSWKVSKRGFCRRAEQVLRRRFRGNAWPARRTNVGALLQLCGSARHVARLTEQGRLEPSSAELKPWCRPPRKRVCQAPVLDGPSQPPTAAKSAANLRQRQRFEGVGNGWKNLERAC